MSNITELQQHIANNASNAVIIFKHEDTGAIEDNGNGVTSSCYRELVLDDKNALRLGAFHNIVAKLVESDDGWFISGNDETDGLLTAQGMHYNLVALRHFFKDGSLGEVSIRATVSSFDKGITDICISFDCDGISAANDKWIRLEEAIHNPDAVIKDIDLFFHQALDSGYGTFDYVNLNEMPIDDNIIKQMTIENAENIKLISINENKMMTVTYDFQLNGFTNYGRTELHVPSYLKIAKLAWQSFLQQQSVIVIIMLAQRQVSMNQQHNTKQLALQDNQNH